MCAGHIPLPRSRCRALFTQLPPGDSPPPAQRSPARPLPTLPRRESGRAGDKETPACLHSLSFYPARDTPRRPPSTPATPRAHTPGKGTRGQGAGWACPLSPRRAATAARAPRPGTPLGSRAPIIHSLKRPGPLTLPPPAQTTSTIPPAERQGGAAHTKRMGSKEPRGGRDPAGARGLGSRRLFTRFLLRSLRCLRR